MIKTNSFILLAVVLVGLYKTNVAQSASISWPNRSVQLSVREQPIKSFLEEIGSVQGVPIIVSDEVRGNVSGQFNGNAQQVFDKIAKAYSLLPYFDGAALHIYSASEVRTQTIMVSPGVVGKYVDLLKQLGLFDAKNSFRAMPATGVILLTGAPRFVEQAVEVANAVQLQGEDGKATFRAFKLNHASAADTRVIAGGKDVVLPGVATILKSLISSDSNSKRTYLDSNRSVRPTLEKLRGKGLASVGRSESDNAKTKAQIDTASEDSAASGVATAGPGVRIEAEPRMNAVLIRDSAERMPYYEQLIASLDIESSQVEIEATVIDLNVDRLLELGINWRLQSGRFEWLFGSGGESDERLRPGVQTTPSSRGLAVSTILGANTNIVARVKALSAQGAARIVSSPQILTMENVEAVLENTRTFYVRVAGRDEVDLYNVSAGTVLRVTPNVINGVNNQARIRLIVQIDDGSVTDQTVDSIPIVDKTSISAQNVITEGESLLIGGLVRERSAKAVEKIPLLGDIPVIGKLFQTTAESGSRTERLFLLTPRLINPDNVPQRLKAPRMAPQYGLPVPTGSSPLVMNGSNNNTMPPPVQLPTVTPFGSEPPANKTSPAQTQGTKNTITNEYSGDMLLEEMMRARKK
jgi:type III secretion protein C